MKKLFDKIGSRFGERDGGYTRIMKLGPRKDDGAEQAMLEPVGSELVKRAAERAKRRGERLKTIKSSGIFVNFVAGMYGQQGHQ